MDLLLVFAAAFAFYCWTLAPTVIWGDSASFSMRAFVRWLQFGTAGDHPLFVLVGSLFAALPGDVARNVNLVSAVFGAATVMLVYRCGRQLGTSRAAAAVGAASLCVSHAFWLHSVIAEVYTANAFFLVTAVSLLLEWRARSHWGWLAAAFAMFAIGLTNHLVLATALPSAVAFVLISQRHALLRRRSLAWGGAVLGILTIGTAALIAFSPVGAVVQRLWYGPPPISEYLSLNVAPGLMVREAGYYVLYLIYQFPSFSLVLGALGVIALLRDRRPEGLLLLLSIAVNAFTFIKHTVWASAGGAKYVFYIADYALFAICCAVGTHEVVRWIAARRGPGKAGRYVPPIILAAVAVVPPVVYAAMPSLEQMAGVDLVKARQLPHRDNSRFYLNPNKRGEDGARRFGEHALQVARPGAVIFADHTPYTVLMYLQWVEKTRPDVLVRGAPDGQAVKVHWVSEGGKWRPTYVASLSPGYYDFQDLTGEYDLIPTGSIVEVRPRVNP